MESSSSLFPSPKLASLPSSSARATHRKKSPVRWVVAARRGPGGRDYWGKLVDENMIVLRMRIREIKMLDTSSQSAPSDWMEWEKRYYLQHYNEDVCQAVGLLQTFLMNIRPCLALGFLAFFSLSVPVSAAMGMFQAIEMAKQLFYVLTLMDYFGKI